MAGLSIFIFKTDSRNNADKTFDSGFEENYIKLFGLRLPVMETVHTFMKKLSENELENLKKLLVKQLINKRVLDKYRYKGKFLVAIDGTGVSSFEKEPFVGCPYKINKNGKKTWQVYVLEAKIICNNNFSLSIATEWLCNSDNIEDKQDCELKAFVRLAGKIKKNYLRTPIIIAADALYPNNTFFDICTNNKWDYILTFKEGCLKSVWEEVNLLYPLDENKNKQEKIIFDKTKKILCSESIMFINNIPYKKHNLNWLEYKCTEEKTSNRSRFVHITNIEVNKSNVWALSHYGRLRWKIENEGFNTQKNNGYNLQHKYSRNNFTAMQNYYQLIQIAHIINQLAELSLIIKTSLKTSGHTLKSICLDVIASMKKECYLVDEIQQIVFKIKQVRY